MKILDVPQSGSVAGVTSSRNRFGQYRRTRAIPVNPDTTLQGAARSRFGTLSSQWSALTAARREAWQAWADTHPSQDSLGQAITLTGAMAFLSVNMLAETIGEDPTLDPPADVSFGLGGSVDEVAAPREASLDGGALVGLNIPVEGAPAPSSAEMIVYGGPPMSAGRTFNGRWNNLGSFALAEIDTSGFFQPSAAAVATAYVAVFGSPPLGSLVPVRASAWSAHNVQPWFRVNVPTIEI